MNKNTVGCILVPKETHFTLYSDTRKGNRPNFIEAARPKQAKALYNDFNEKLTRENIIVETGILKTIGFGPLH